MMVKITEIANPAAVGWRWVSESGTEYEICWTRGHTRLSMGAKPATGRKAGQWVHWGLLDEKWNHDGTLKGARVKAHEFING